jgi:hypothetical protein
MLIVVAVDTQQLPVAAIRRIVIVVVILMVDREFSNSFARKFAPAPRTDPRKHLERSFPIGLLSALSIKPSLGYDLIAPVGITVCLLR